jgi:DNA helicase-4
LIRLQQSAVFGLLVNPLGTTARAIELDGSLFRIARRGQIQEVSLSAMTMAPVLLKGLLGTRLVIPAGDAGDIVLRGAREREARAFSAQLRQVWVAYNLSALDSQRAQFDRLYHVITNLVAPNCYPAACSLTPALADARELDSAVLSKIRPEAVGIEEATRITVVRQFVTNPRTARANAISAFVTAELDRWKDFFDTIESKPLTPEQRLSVVVDEDATLVLAGAGSGKTSVITAKAAYLVKAGIRQPEEILLLAFAKNAAEEMSERVEARSGVPIVARTFHAIAYDIIGIVEGSKPALADHATDDTAFSNLIKQILKDLVYHLSEVSKAIIQFFAHFLVEPKTEWDFKTKHDFYTHMEAQDLRTLQGEKVKSYEELQIANWLYENGVDYEYEPIYEHKVSEIGRRDYQPDFRLTESGIYIEHFGVRREKTRDGSERLVTAPFVDRD